MGFHHLHPRWRFRPVPETYAYMKEHAIENIQHPHAREDIAAFWKSAIPFGKNKPLLSKSGSGGCG